MEESIPAFDWQSSLLITYQELTRQTIEHIPQLLGALVLFLAGWLVAWLLSILTRKLIRGLDILLLRAAQKRDLPHVRMRNYARMVGNIVFWSVLLFFIAASANMLDWKIFAGVTQSLLTLLPNVLSGLLIILAGFVFSGMARAAVARAADTTGIAQAELLARIAQISVVLTAAVIGIEQLGINVAFVTSTLLVVLGVLLAGAALAFGLGARQFVANIIGVQSIRKQYQLGQIIRVNDIEGPLLEVTPTSIVLETDQGRALIPAKFFHEQISHVLIDEPDEANDA